VLLVMSEEVPLISVILPVRNGERYVCEAIDSILKQSCDDLELLIIDDHSTDTTAELIQGFDDSRISVIKPEPNGHLTSALNVVRGMARGEFIARMDADDIAHPDRLKKQLSYMRENPEVGILGTQVRQINAEGEEMLSGQASKPLVHAEIVSSLFFGCALWHPTVMLRKSVLDALGWYGSPVIKGREQFSGEDYDLWSRAVGSTKIANLPDVLLDYRVHDSNLSLAASGRKDHCLNTVLVLREYIRNRLSLNIDLNVCAAMLQCGPNDLPPGAITRAIPEEMFALVRPIIKHAVSEGITNDEKARLRPRLSAIFEFMLWQQGYNIFRKSVRLCLIDPLIGLRVLFSSLKRFF
jgi:glycosyltransferase involved in cell wall biosynthesis